MEVGSCIVDGAMQNDGQLKSRKKEAFECMIERL